MNDEADDLLDMVDEWKYQRYDQLKTMTPEERAAFWQETRNRARAMGLPIADSKVLAQRRLGQVPRATA